MSYFERAATRLPTGISVSGEMPATSRTLEHVREAPCAAIIARCESAVCLWFAFDAGERTADPPALHVPCRMDLQKNGQNRNYDCAGARAGGADRRNAQPGNACRGGRSHRTIVSRGTGSRLDRHPGDCDGGLQDLRFSAALR